MQKQKGISTLVGIIIIITVAVVLFGSVFAYQYFTKQPQNSNFFASRPKTYQTQTAGWKTYTNTQYGFKFEYPAKYSNFTKDSKNYAGGLAKVQAVFVEKASMGEDSLSVSEINIGNYRFSDTGSGNIFYDTKADSCSGNLNLDLNKTDNFNFSESKGCYISDGDVLWGLAGYLIPDTKNGRIIEIKIEYFDSPDRGPKWEDKLADLRQILSTFKFTK